MRPQGRREREGKGRGYFFPLEAGRCRRVLELRLSADGRLCGVGEVGQSLWASICCSLVRDLPASPHTVSVPHPSAISPTLCSTTLLPS